MTYAFPDAWERELEGDIPLQADEDVRSDPGALVDKGVEMLGVFLEQVAKSLTGVEIKAVEKPFSVDLHDPTTGEVQEEKLIGTFDLVVKDGERHGIVESKTSARKYGDDQVRWDLQATAYQFARKAMGVANIGVRYDVLTKTKVPARQVIDLDRSAADEEEFLRVTMGVLRGIDIGVFIPQRGWGCGGCLYSHACRSPRR